MRVASNKLKDIIGFYQQELSGVYSKNEIDALAGLAIAHYLGYSNTELLRRLDSNVNQSALIKLYDCAKALKQNRPLQYILGEAWFYGLSFRVNEQVLIPRPETEELVELILKENLSPGSFLDIGTGSGCIPVTLKKHQPQSQVNAADISTGALEVARENAGRHQTDISFFEADVLTTGSFVKAVGGPFEVMVSNPPYIQLSEKAAMSPHVADQEPDLALFVNGTDPIVFYKKIIDLCAELLLPQGRLYFELNPLTAEAVKEYAEHSQLFAQVQLVKDMSGNTRFLKGVRRESLQTE
jgi:release factor glutamine methyltransferase